MQAVMEFVSGVREVGRYREVAKRRIDEYARRLVGIGLDETVERLPSTLVGSVRQSIACFRRAETYGRRGGPALMLVPGLFCMPSVFNRLGRELECRGVDIYLPRPFPVPFGVFANTGRLEQAVDGLLDDLESLHEEGLESLCLAGHSLGGLIILRALQRGELEERRLPRIDGVVLIATPLEGAPIAGLIRSLVPACRDLSPGANILALLEPELDRVTHVVASDFDLLVPSVGGKADKAKMTIVKGFQHMDFYVGTSEQVASTADTLVSILPELRKKSRIEEAS